MHICSLLKSYQSQGHSSIMSNLLPLLLLRYSLRQQYACHTSHSFITMVVLMIHLLNYRSNAFCGSYSERMFHFRLFYYSLVRHTDVLPYIILYYRQILYISNILVVFVVGVDILRLTSKSS